MGRPKEFEENEVLEKAMNLFWKNGYNATSMQMLVTGLGINRASIYDTFGGKREIFDKAFTQYREQNMKRVRAYINEQDSPLQAMKDLLIMSIEGQYADPDKKSCFIVNTTTELSSTESEIREVLSQNKAEMIEIFSEALKNSEEMGEIKKGQDLKSLASMIYTLFSGLQIVGKLSSNKEELINTVNAGFAAIQLNS